MKYQLYGKTSPMRTWGLLHGLLILLSLPFNMSAETTSPKGPTYKIIGDSTLLIRLNNSSDQINSAKLLDLGDANGHLSWNAASMSCGSDKLDWVHCTISGSSLDGVVANPRFESKHSYVVVYTEIAKAGPIAKPTSLTISSSPDVTLVYALQVSGYLYYQLTSNVAFRHSGNPAGPALEAESCPSSGNWKNVALGNAAASYSVSSKNFIDDPNRVGVVCIRIKRAPYFHEMAVTAAQGNAFLQTLGLESVLNETLDTSGPLKFTLPTPPASKDDARFYANLNIVSGTGVHGAWGLDGKISELPYSPGLFGHALTITWLSASANVGNNVANIKGQTYTDTIDWMLPIEWIPPSKAASPFGVIIDIMPKYETDRLFDRKNLLVSGDVTYIFRPLYQPQEVRTAKTSKGTPPKYGEKGYAAYGYLLEFHTGLEAGGALSDTIQKATSGNATQVVPGYSITRAIPEIRGLFQRSLGPLGLLSFDSTIAGRYLIAKENTVEQAKDLLLRLRPIGGWKAINTLSSTWNPPRSGNVGVTATYKDGFDAPKFTRVNSVLIGVTIKF